MDFKIIGGMSTCGSVAIQSNLKRARATCRRDGTIDCVVRPLSWYERFEYAHPKAPIPRVLWYSVFWLANLKRRTWLWLAPLVAALYGAQWLVHTYYPAPPSQHHSSFMDQMLIMTLGLIIMAYYTRLRVAKWHGAEHMAVSAYWEHGQTSLEAIRRENPINSHCGGRFIIPIAVMELLSMFALRRYMPTIAAGYVGLEVALWIDKFWGFNRIPGTSQLSWLLQKYFTTSQPGEVELKTAQRALLELVAAHA